MIPQIPDPSWKNGEYEEYGDVRDYFCPVCGAENPEEFVLDQNDEVIGCNRCCRFEQADNWLG